MDSPSGSVRRLILRARPGRPGRSRGSSGPSAGLEPCSAGAPSRLSPNERQWDLTGFLVTPPAPLPCSETPAESVVLAIADFPTPPPSTQRRRLRRLLHFEAATPLQRPLSTLHGRRRRRPCKTRFRLAGSAFAGRVSNPPGHAERFQLIASPFPGLDLSLCILQFSTGNVKAAGRLTGGSSLLPGGRASVHYRA